jgi:hypothetical protein
MALPRLPKERRLQALGRDRGPAAPESRGLRLGDDDRIRHRRLARG